MITYDMVQAKDKYKESREKRKEEKKDSDRERYRKKESDKASERAKVTKRKKEKKERERIQTGQALIICWLMIKRHAVAKRHAVVDLSFIYLNQIRVFGL